MFENIFFPEMSFNFFLYRTFILFAWHEKYLCITNNAKVVNRNATLKK